MNKLIQFQIEEQEHFLPKQCFIHSIFGGCTGNKKCIYNKPNCCLHYVLYKKDKQCRICILTGLCGCENASYILNSHKKLIEEW